MTGFSCRCQIGEFINWVFAEDSEGLGVSVKGAVSDATLLVAGAMVEGPSCFTVLILKSQLIRWTSARHAQILQKCDSKTVEFDIGRLMLLYFLPMSVSQCL